VDIDNAGEAGCAAYSLIYIFLNGISIIATKPIRRYILERLFPDVELSWGNHNRTSM